MKPGITVITSFSYRGATEEYSNTYHFTGTAPSDATGWNALCAEAVTLIKAGIPPQATMRRIYCYTDTSADSVYTYTLADHGGAVAGTAVVSSGFEAPGDAAYWVRWTTGRTSSKGKAVYLRKYYHPAWSATGSPDNLDTGIKSAAASMGTSLLGATGAWPGLAGPTYDLSGSVATASTYVTTRTLKRRGKRP